MVAHSDASFVADKVTSMESHIQQNIETQDDASLVRQRKSNNNGSTENLVHNESEKKRKESCLTIRQNGSIVLELGKYRAATFPLLALFLCFLCATFSFWDRKPDPRVAHLPLLGSDTPAIVITIAYIFFSLVWGPRAMEHREPFKLKKFIMIYNVIQVVGCAYMFIEVSQIAWLRDYNYQCQPCDYSTDELPMRMTRVTYLYYISKIVDLLDTVFFILNKKFSHVSLLHVVHHSNMVYGTMRGARFYPGGHGTFFGFLNVAVHVLMYSYYLLAAMGPSVRPYLWWKKYLTTVQLIQFVCVFIHSSQLFFIDCPNVPIGIAVWTCIYAVIFFGLFIDFYFKAYGTKTTKGKPVDSVHSSQHLVNQAMSSNKLHTLMNTVSCLQENKYKN